MDICELATLIERFVSANNATEDIRVMKQLATSLREWHRAQEQERLAQEESIRRIAATEPQKRFCPKCKEAGLKSTVQQQYATATLAYYPPTWDEDGNEHHHGGNVTTDHFTCSQGHSWTEKRT